ncbi:hypothetical protein MMRN_34070 [Mycobacterium marinum]|nr:hypothetical protein MMRN_34070 [Mycobacterium marinum]
MFGHDHDPPTGEQGAEDFADGDVEGVGVPLRPHPAGGDFEIELGEQGGGVVVGDGHAFGVPVVPEV